MRKIAITCWILAAFLVVFGWQFRGPLFWHSGIEGQSLFQEIATEAQLEGALADKHSIIFLKLDWSGSNAVFLNDLDQFARDWRFSRQSPHASFYFLDLSDEYGNLKLRMPYVHDWMETDSRISQSARRGTGGMVFTKNGKIVDFVSDNDYFMRTVFTLPELAKHSFD